jgi:aminomethyltransferase
MEGGRFYGADPLRRQADEGTPERLAIFRLTEPGIPRAGQGVVIGGRTAGTVTSGTLSPTLDVGIGMAYVPAASAPPENDLIIDVRGKPKAARTARRPLVATSPRQ